MTLRDRIKRRVIPRVVIALSTIRLPGRLLAAARRARGGRGRVDLYVAFDDPYSAVAVLGLTERLAGRRADLVVHAAVARGIPGDPAVEAKREYAIVDSRRLMRRSDRELSRTAVPPAADVAFLAGWAGGIEDTQRRTDFTAATMRRLWLEFDGPVSQEAFAGLWREHVGGEPPTNGDASSVEKAMRRRGYYDTPIAVVQGQWFFAHERLPQIEHRLDELGWT